MSADPLGLRLRELLLRQAQEAGGLDGRRLQGLVGDLCGADQQDLLPALRYLVLSPPFLRALRARPPLADPRLADQLRAELGQVFAPGLCSRLEPVLQQLLDRPSPPSAALADPVEVLPPMGTAAPAAAHDREAAAGERSSSPSTLVVVLAFLSGGLAVALAAVLSGVELSRPSTPSLPIPSLPRAGQQTTPWPDPVERPTPAVPSAPPLPAPPEELATISPTTETPAGGGAGTIPSAGGTPANDTVAAAVAGVEALYASLSAGDPAGALQKLAGSAADQFDPTYFRQFREVQVSDLRSTATDGAIVNLDGVVTFIGADGSRRRESRSFTVDTAQTPARITASAFSRVLNPGR